MTPEEAAERLVGLRRAQDGMGRDYWSVDLFPAPDGSGGLSLQSSTDRQGMAGWVVIYRERLGSVIRQCVEDALRSPVPAPVSEERLRDLRSLASSNSAIADLLATVDFLTAVVRDMGQENPDVVAAYNRGISVGLEKAAAIGNEAAEEVLAASDLGDSPSVVITAAARAAMQAITIAANAARTSTS